MDLSPSLVAWNPVEDPHLSAITPRTVHRMVSVKYEENATNQRDALHRLRDRLQSALYNGTRNDVIERPSADEDELVLLRDFELKREVSSAHPAAAPQPAVQVAPAAGGEAPVATVESAVKNIATASLLYRQFEMISRRGVNIEEMEERQTVILRFLAQSRVVWIIEKNRAQRSQLEQIDDLKAQLADQQQWSVNAINDLEVTSRARVAQSSSDMVAAMATEQQRIVAAVHMSTAMAKFHAVTADEDRRRHLIAVDHDKGVSQLFMTEMNECHAIELHGLMRASTAQQMRDAAHARRSMLVEPTDESDDSEAASNSSLLPPHAFDWNSHKQSLQNYDTKPVPQYEAVTAPVVGSSLNFDLLSNHAPAKGLHADANKLDLPLKPHNKIAAPKPKATKLSAPGRTPTSPTPKPLADPKPTGATRNRSVPDLEAAARAMSPFGDVPPVPPLAVSAMAQFMRDADVESNHNHNAEDDIIAMELLTHRNQLTVLTKFHQCYGWMLKSTGVLMTWQRRFFALTAKGKLRYTTNDPTQSTTAVKWTTLVNAEDILRVELDTVTDSSSGTRPPMDQYHQYCFYLDFACRDGAKDIHQRRVRLCCFHKADLSTWLVALRHATDVVFALEERGDIPRSPMRRLLDPAMLASLFQGEVHRHYSLKSPTPQTYRQRKQVEEDAAAIEEQRRIADVTLKQRKLDMKDLASLAYSPTRYVD